MLDVDRIYNLSACSSSYNAALLLTECGRQTFISPPLTSPFGERLLLVQCRFKCISSLVLIVSIGAHSLYRITTEHTHHVCPLTPTYPKILPQKPFSRTSTPHPISSRSHTKLFDIQARTLSCFFFFGIPSTARREAAIDKSTRSSSMFHFAPGPAVVLVPSN